LYLSNFLASYLYFYLSTQTRYLLQHGLRQPTKYERFERPSYTYTVHTTA